MRVSTQIALLVLMISGSIAFFSQGGIRKNFFSGILKKSISMSSQDAVTAIAANKVMVFSKTHCPFCTQAKAALTKLNVEYKVIELGQYLFFFSNFRRSSHSFRTVFRFLARQ